MMLRGLCLVASLPGRGPAMPKLTLIRHGAQVAAEEVMREMLKMPDGGRQVSHQTFGFMPPSVGRQDAGFMLPSAARHLV